MRHAVIVVVKSGGPAPAAVPGAIPQHSSHATDHGGHQHGVLAWPPPGCPGLRRNCGKFKFKFAGSLRPCGGTPGGWPSPPPHLDLTTVGPLDARLYRHWLCQGNGVV